MNISERSTTSLMEQFRHQCVAILRKFTGYILPSSGKVVVFDHRLPIRHAFMGLVEHDIKCGPVWNRLVRDFIGMLAVTDFIDILIHFHSMQKKSSAAAPPDTQHSDSIDSITSNASAISPTDPPPPTPSSASPGQSNHPNTASTTTAAATSPSTRTQTLRNVATTPSPGGSGRRTPTSRSSRSSKPSSSSASRASHVLTGSSVLFTGIEDLTVMKWTELKLISRFAWCYADFEFEPAPVTSILFVSILIHAIVFLIF